MAVGIGNEKRQEQMHFRKVLWKRDAIPFPRDRSPMHNAARYYQTDRGTSHYTELCSVTAENLRHL